MNKSFLKWAGGKYDLLPTLIPIIQGLRGGDKGRYIEPFLGGGALALNIPLRVPKFLNDINPGVHMVWEQLKSDPETLIAKAKDYFRPKYNTEQWFYALRDEYNVGRPENGHLFLYLNRHCFNGLCRFNAKGKFNVPYGRYKTIYFPEKELRHAAEIAKNVEVSRLDFVDVMNMATQGDVVYCDPPYLPLSGTSNFTAYSKGGFTMEQQWSLVARAERLRDRGVAVIISNNDTALARKMYGNADEIHSVQVAKRISCKGSGRKKQGEIIAVYSP